MLLGFLQKFWALVKLRSGKLRATNGLPEDPSVASCDVDVEVIGVCVDVTGMGGGSNHMAGEVFHGKHSAPVGVTFTKPL